MRKTIEILANAFSYGEIDLLAEYLWDNCRYSSDYAQRHITSAKQILNIIKTVYENVVASETDCSYSHEIVDIKSIFNEGFSVDDLRGESFGDVCEDAILLYQYGAEKPVAVVYIKLMADGKISEIHLSRDDKFFDVKFYGADKLKDSERDIPYTVKPMTSQDRRVKEIQQSLSDQHLEYEELDDSEVYVWRQADKYFKAWLNSVDYYVLETAVFDECIGYKCEKAGEPYTIYMFAFGQRNKQYIDGSRCAKYIKYDFSEGTVLVSHLHVKRIVSGENVEYRVGFHTGADNSKIELWRPWKLQERDVLLFYPSKEMDKLTEKLVVAMNEKNFDLLEQITSANSPYFDGYDNSGHYFNDAFYTSLNFCCERNGKIKLGYMSFDKVIYSLVPYIEGYGWFDFSVDNETKIVRISSHKFIDDEEHELADFIYADITACYKVDIPRIVSVQTFSPITTERFAMKILFENGEVKKYVLPIRKDQAQKEVVSYKRHVFTDGIWKTAQITNNRTAGVNGYPNCGQGVVFKNGFSISGLMCHENSTDYAEPVLCDEIIFEDKEFRLKKKWNWNVKSVYEDKETGTLKVLLNGEAFNWHGISTIATPNGTRSTLEFRYLSDFRDGLAVVSVAGSGCGYINSSGDFVVPPIYDSASAFQGGFAEVKKDNQRYIVDSSGKIESIKEREHDSRYEEIGSFSEGLCKVSTLKLGMMDLAYHSDTSYVAGVWGYINEQGEEVIAPQYIYAYDFQDGFALVAKGKWTREEKWNNKYNKGRYWTDTELWGAIDRTGKEVIPCIFDEINTFFDNNEVFKVHYGGWENGKWGVIDNKGNWLTEPTFESIGYEYKDGLFDFYVEDSFDDVPIGVYDINQKRIIFEPQFDDVSFLEDGYIEVELFDEILGRKVTRIIDKEGKEKFHSEYSSIRTYEKPYVVTINTDDKCLYGLIDTDGNVILPCKYECDFDGIQRDRIVCKENGKCVVMDFEGNIIIPALYDEVSGFNNPLLTIAINFEDERKLYGLATHEGMEIIAPQFNRISWCRDGGIICVGTDGCVFLQYQEIR